MKQLGSILDPVTVEYPKEVLLNQLYGISIALLIISLCIIILVIAFIFNVVVYINSDRILKFFKNKYILTFVKFNLRVMSIEIVILGLSILYFMYFISKGLLFICTRLLNLGEINCPIPDIWLSNSYLPFHSCSLI